MGFNGDNKSGSASPHRGTPTRRERRLSPLTRRPVFSPAAWRSGLSRSPKDGSTDCDQSYPGEISDVYSVTTGKNRDDWIPAIRVEPDEGRANRDRYHCRDPAHRAQP